MAMTMETTEDIYRQEYDEAIDDFMTQTKQELNRLLLRISGKFEC
jgi:hypothetical protein